MIRYFARPTQIPVSHEGVSLAYWRFSQLARRYADGRPQVLRDQRDRGRDIEGIIKQWFTFVKPNFEKASPPSVQPVLRRQGR